ncbi:MAG: hypothetical protein Q8P72_01910 [Candidatus Roizmanbacteria bacterium]|uniref:Uncharacterized protein n=2 Tax=Candidatus Roizmaniibacteriota TaxID=1752723 RepID=A0A2M8F4T9_9BACT|nr:hypothetical protein [Candidatus Roizmanbacteria bacterium]PIZ65069.1 MAG: hypothetical protein COY15_03920 [Candidatus Roizmanbacteria bacterium CG_4_10_14_0_2_um_filter_39_12]PJC34315.1 MAG: hypothetical protein CO051_00150 [Candidatus Roizmanbacteria bacterium CG_4_9_14_0_2_um_filter_39_13]PJE61868.1 MAG: hypothetical protein COU87_02325 [Candidatus Roizmanbacteria bacterium CG10_big_fil_rev_8_21_14_0_10_39_12]
MGYSRTYQGIIWTNHALERLAARKIPQEFAWKTFRFPDGSKQGKSGGSQEFVKKIENHTITLIAKQNEKNEWLILSAWIDPPYQGSIDMNDRYKKRESTLSWLFRTILGLFQKKQ